MDYSLRIKKPRPYFAEVPYYLWGTVNYDSEGDCKYPTDKEWNWLQLTNTETKETLVMAGKGEEWTITGDDPTAARAAKFLADYCSSGSVAPPPEERMGIWQHTEAVARISRMEQEFLSPKLERFDSQYFWGSWKWIGWFATDFTWVGRWIMISVLMDDARGIPLCIDWLKQGTFHPDQSYALKETLCQLSGMSFGEDDEWIRWYEGGLFKRGARSLYPVPDFDAWLIELKEMYKEVT